VPTSQFIKSLSAARLAADVQGVPTVLVARTDADLYVLDRERLVAAVGGDVRSVERAEDTMAKRLSELDRLPLRPA